MRIVVTGASGNVGSALLRSLRGRGSDALGAATEVVGVARRPEPRVAPYDRVSWIGCDVGAPGADTVLTEVFRDAAAVVHLAWAIQPTTWDPGRHRTNVDGTAAVLRAAGRAEVAHVVCASSVAAYTPAPRWTHVTEDWPRGGIPGSAYSQDKVATEDLLDRFAVRHPATTVTRIRPCAVVQRSAAAEIAAWTLSPLVPRALLGRRLTPIPVWPQLRAQMVHSDDVADALYRILAGRVGGTFNLAAGPVLNWRDLASILGGFAVPVPRRALALLAWPTWRTGLQPAHPGWLTMSDRTALVDTSHAEQTLGWKPGHDSVSALAELVAGIRSGATGASPPLRPDRTVHRVLSPSHQSQRPRVRPH